MPIENERKFILDIKNPSSFKTTLANWPITNICEYRQGYLNDNTRIREISHQGEVIDVLFTYKKKINGKLIEIETSISPDDFKALWTQVHKVINKTRVAVSVGEYMWEVDFFIDQATRDYYLVMAEVELPDGLDMPDQIPDFITDNLLYLVPQTDLRFTNTRLGQPQIVKKILKDFRDGKFHNS